MGFTHSHNDEFNWDVFHKHMRQERDAAEAAAAAAKAAT